MPRHPSSSSLVSLSALAARVCDKHPDQVRLYASGKSCVGFLVTQVLKLAQDSQAMLYAHKAVISELEFRTKTG